LCREFSIYRIIRALKKTLFIMNEEQRLDTPDKSAPKPGFGKLFTDLIINIIIPVLVLRRLSGDDQLGPVWALVLALSFPLAAGIYEFARDKKVGLVPAIGFISILLTGGIALLQLPKEYIAIKEALVPLGFGVAVLLSTFSKRPLIRTFIYNDMFMRTDLVADEVQKRGRESDFDGLMVKATWILASSFLLSSILNYALAKWIIVSPTGTPEFNEELGTMTLLSYPVIVVPSMILMFYAMYFVISRILKMTELSLEDIMRE